MTSPPEPLDFRSVRDAYDTVAQDYAGCGAGRMSRYLADRRCLVEGVDSIIHTPPAGQARIFAEVSRVLRPGGRVLVGFQYGAGSRDVSAAYRRFGHHVRLERQLYTADEVAVRLGAVGLREACRRVSDRPVPDRWPGG